MNREDVINKVFPHSLFGYDPVAVDAFLDEVIREFDRLNNSIDVLQLRLAQELGETRQLNDLLSADIARTGFLERAAQIPALSEPKDNEPAPEGEGEAGDKRTEAEPEGNEEKDPADPEHETIPDNVVPFRTGEPSGRKKKNKHKH